MFWKKQPSMNASPFTTTVKLAYTPNERPRPKESQNNPNPTTLQNSSMSQSSIKFSQIQPNYGLSPNVVPSSIFQNQPTPNSDFKRINTTVTPITNSSLSMQNDSASNNNNITNYTNTLAFQTMALEIETSIKELEAIVASNTKMPFALFDVNRANQLHSLYKKAAIFYEEIDVAKITYYKHRMTEIQARIKHHEEKRRQIQAATNAAIALGNLKSPKELQLEFSETIGTARNSAPIEVIQSQAALKNKMKQLQEEPQMCITDADVHQILDTQDNKVLEQEVVIEKDLKKQHNMIQKRLSKRIKANQNNLNASQIVVNMKSEGCSESTESSCDLSEANLDQKRQMQYQPQQERKLFDSNKSRTPIQSARTSLPSDEKNSDRILAAFITDKTRSLQEEKALKLERIDFHFEKLFYQLSLDSQKSFNETEKNILIDQKQQQIKEVEDDFKQREMQQITQILSKYNNLNQQSQQFNQNLQPKLTINR